MKIISFWAYCPFGVQFLILHPCDGNYLFLLLLIIFFRRILHSKGELSEDRHKQYEEFATSYQKLLANTQSLADLLDENMPELPQDKTVQEGAYEQCPLGVHSSISSFFFLMPMCSSPPPSARSRPRHRYLYAGQTWRVRPGGRHLGGRGRTQLLREPGGPEGLCARHPLQGQ